MGEKRYEKIRCEKDVGTKTLWERRWDKNLVRKALWDIRWETSFEKDVVRKTLWKRRYLMVLKPRNRLCMCFISRHENSLTVGVRLGSAPSTMACFFWIRAWSINVKCEILCHTNFFSGKYLLYQDAVFINNYLNRSTKRFQ